MRAARRIVTIVLLVQVAWALPLGLVLGFALDWSYLLAFGGVALAFVVLLLCFMLAWQRADVRRDELLSRGTRTHGVLVSTRPTGTRINNRRVLAHTFESHEPGRRIQAVAKAFAHLPIGAEVTIAYDPADPSRAVVVEDLDLERS